MTALVPLSGWKSRVLRALADAIATRTPSGLRRNAVPIWEIAAAITRDVDVIPILQPRLQDDLWSLHGLGLVEITPRACWSITPAGRDVLEQVDR